MNCKPGDLAIIIRDAPTCQTAGRLVEVLYAAPGEEFTLPDGKRNQGTRPGSWVIKSLGSPFSLLTVGGYPVTSMYATAPDAVLRPLPGETVDEEITTEVMA